MCLRDEQLRWCRTFRAGFAVAEDGTTRTLLSVEERFWWDQRYFADSRDIATGHYIDELATRGAEVLAGNRGSQRGHTTVEGLSTSRAGSELVVTILWWNEDEIELTVSADRGRHRPPAIQGLLITDRQRLDRLTDNQLADRGYY